MRGSPSLHIEEMAVICVRADPASEMQAIQLFDSDPLRKFADRWPLILVYNVG